MRQYKHPYVPRMGAAGLLAIRPCARLKRRCKRNPQLIPHPMRRIQRGCHSHHPSPSLPPRQPTMDGHWWLCRPNLIYGHRVLNLTNTTEQAVRLLHIPLVPSKSQCPHNYYLSRHYPHLRRTPSPGLCLRPGSLPAPDLEIGHEGIPQLIWGQTMYRSRMMRTTNSSLPHCVHYFLPRKGMRPDFIS